MSDEPIPTIPTAQKQTLGDRIRGIANQLRQENDVQIKATSRILGAAAQIAQNHDRLIDEVVEMVEEDLDQQASIAAFEPYTVERLKQQFQKDFKAAKAHFGVTANGWGALVSKLNEPTEKSSTKETAKSSKRGSTTSSAKSSKTQDSTTQRLEAIERDIQTMQGDINQILNLLNQIVGKLP
ncbi:hypothetical protein H6G89_22870 [Oscillatoria sp. FACHB-1407]|uniref:hypothetical protein n=1 Tax=Oscillatoria sp. FACHB-1407 TaxID=2692847 RepID=UPI001683076A|nr:hypothetical protein [Oscillatoria sp. FACHB-1407]MBD2463848.1 hypothetical protein [Oscillatoria sp. FACHB-1407]